jgi:hypothetical protein
MTHAGVAGRTWHWLPALMIAAAVVMTPLLFIGGPDYFAPRSLRLAWDFGHVLLFACIGGLLGRARSGARTPVALLWLLAGAAALAVALGTGIEWLQRFAAGRESSGADVWRDLSGVLLGVALFARTRSGVATRLRLAVLACATLAIVFTGLVPLVRALADEAEARSAFPVLADFETTWQAERFTAVQPPRIVDSPAGPNTTRVLRVELYPANYSGFTLKHFPRDWRGFRTLSFEVYREPNGPARITCRINDRAHETDNRFTDRYNERFELQPGWNRVLIDLEEVRKAPAGRSMSLDDVTGVGCFATALQDRQRLYLDNWALESAITPVETGGSKAGGAAARAPANDYRPLVGIVDTRCRARPAEFV